MIRVLLLDEHELVRIGLKTVLKQDKDIEVIADSDDYQSAAGLIKRSRPDIVLVDISERHFQECPDNEADRAKTPEVFKLLSECCADTKLVLMSTAFNLDCLLHTLCGDSAGYLMKSTSPTELLAAVHAIAHGGVYIHSALMECFPKQLLRGSAGRRPSLKSSTPPLSEQEHTVLDLLVKGYTNREISKQMYLSPKTVETYRARVYSKLGVKNRAGLFSRAIEHGLVAI
jgi:two-component system response regulator NreC